MKIVFATNSLAFQNPGGGERVFQDLFDALDRAGHSVWKYDPLRPCPFRPDVIHFFSCRELSLWTAFRSLYPDVPFFVTPVRFFPSSPTFRIKALIRRFSKRNDPAYALPTGYFPTTETEARGLCRYLGVPAGKIRILPNGIRDSLIRRALGSTEEEDRKLLLERFGVKGSFVANVGRFDPVKNQATLIEACGSIGLPAVFVGEADLGSEGYFDECRKKAAAWEKRNPKAKFHFLGRLDHDDPALAAVFRSARVFALPSHFETFGIAALEAAALGTRVVMTDRLAAKDVFSFARKAQPFNAKVFASALLSEWDRPRYSAEFQEALRARFSWNAITETLVDFYRDFSAPVLTDSVR